MVAALRILTVLGTRPEAIKLAPLIRALERDSRFVSRVCVTAQHRQMLDQVLSLTGIVPDHDLDLMRPEQSLDSLTARALEGIGRVLDAERPDWVVVQGDTTTAMAGALAAHYRRIPVCHVEAGLRSGDLLRPWPEEANRRMIGAIATLHCAPTRSAAQALLAENVDPETVHVTGNTVVDALRWTMGVLAKDPDLARALRPWEARFEARRIIALTTHRRENLGAGQESIAAAVRTLARREDVAILLPLHPNPEIARTMRAAFAGYENVALLEPLDYPQFVRLLAISHFVLTDSGGVQEEAPALGRPVLVLRDTTERPEGVVAGTAKLVGTDRDTIVAEATRLLDDEAAYAAMAQAHSPYGDGHAAARICDLLSPGGRPETSRRTAECLLPDS